MQKRNFFRSLFQQYYWGRNDSRLADRYSDRNSGNDSGNDGRNEILYLQSDQEIHREVVISMGDNDVSQLAIQIANAVKDKDKHHHDHDKCVTVEIVVIRNICLKDFIKDFFCHDCDHEHEKCHCRDHDDDDHKK